MKALVPALVVAALLLSACVPVPEDMMDEVTPAGAGTVKVGADAKGFPPLDANGAAEFDGLNFHVQAYGKDNAQQISQKAEAIYSRIVVDANLYSFTPSKPYDLVVYGSWDEYHAKTMEPTGMDSVIVGRTLYSYGGPRLTQEIAHQTTHLVLREYLGDQIVQTASFRWIDEGLACYEEGVAAADAGAGDLFSAIRQLLNTQPMPITSITQMPPYSEQGRPTSLWYCESESMVEYLLTRGGRTGFSALLLGMRTGHALDQAIGQAYPGTFADSNSFYQSWTQNIPAQ